MKTVAIDFDGVIHRYSKGWFDGTIYDGPVDDALESLAKLREKCAVAIFTTRNVDDVAHWLEENHVPRTAIYGGSGLWPGYPFWSDPVYLLITNLKPAASIYIDDRSVRFETWDQTLADLAAIEKIEIE